MEGLFYHYQSIVPLKTQFYDLYIENFAPQSKIKLRRKAPGAGNRIPADF